MGWSLILKSLILKSPILKSPILKSLIPIANPHVCWLMTHDSQLVFVLAFREARFGGRQDVAVAGDPDVQRGQQEDAHHEI